jgi:outer membrane protein assembly factor BamB
MRNTTTITLFAASLMSACRNSSRAPLPTFAELFPPVVGDLMTFSSPNVADLDGDGVPDIVFGTGVERVHRVGARMVFSGEPDTSGYIVAVSGATNTPLWKSSAPRDAFTTARFVRLNGDSVPDVVMGGREGVLSAFNGATGAPLWRLEGKDVIATPFPYNFYTPAVIKDVNGDGVADLVDFYAGNDTRMPNEPRDAGYVAVISGATGAVRKVLPSPDGAEIYASPVVYERPDGQEWVIIGTGGETHGGAAYRAPVSSLLDGTFASRTERLIEPGAQKGVIAPATLVDLTGDGELDIVISTFDGRLIAVDGASRKILWQHENSGEEAYHGAAVTRLTSDGRLGLVVSRGIGVFPKYVGTVHRVYVAADGRMLYEYRDPNYPGGAPLAVDINGDRIDEVFFFSTRFPSAEGGRIHMLHVPSKKLITHDVAANFWGTPIIAGARGKGTLELIGLAWRKGSNDTVPAWKDLQWQLFRLDLSAKTPGFRGWAGYMGTDADGRYRPAPTTNR